MTFIQYLLIFAVLVLVINLLREYFDSYRSDFDYKIDTRNAKKIQRILRRIITSNSIKELIDNEDFHLSGIFGELDNNVLDSIDTFKEAFSIEYNDDEKIESIYSSIFSSLVKGFSDGFPNSETGVGFKCTIDIKAGRIIKCQVCLYDLEETLGGSNDSLRRFEFLYRINIQKTAKILGIILAVFAVLVVGNYGYRYNLDVKDAKSLEDYLQVTVLSNDIRSYAKENSCGALIEFDTSLDNNWFALDSDCTFSAYYYDRLYYALLNGLPKSKTGDGFRGKLLITPNGESECWVVANCENVF